MAWGSWSSAKQTTALSGTNYDVLIEWRYRRDVVANKSQIQTLRFGVKSKTAYHSFSSENTTIGLCAPTIPHSDGIHQKLSFSVSANSTSWYNIADTTATITHNADGSFPSGYHIDWYFNPSISVIGSPSGMIGTSWHTLSLNGKISSINRNSGSAYIDSTTPSYSKMTAKIHLQFWGHIYAKISEVSSTWTKIGTTSKDGEALTYIFTGLKPNKKYTLQVYGTRTYNGCSTKTVTSSFTTKAVPAPSTPPCTLEETVAGVVVTMAQGGVVYDETTAYDGTGGALNLCIHKNPPSQEEGTFTVENLPTWPTLDYREYMTIAQLRAGYTIQQALEPGVYGFRVWTNAPLSGAKSIYQWVAYIGKSGNVYILTSNGWQKGTPYVLTPTGWKTGTLYIKTATEWKK